MQGADLARRPRPADQGPESAFFQIFGPFQADGVTAGWRGVRTARYMYARYEHEPWVLYDLQADPFELTNLAARAVRRGGSRRHGPQADRVDADDGRLLVDQLDPSRRG